MIKEEAYQKMSEGYMVTHRLFNPNEYLYMDDCFIIRSQDGEVFESDWDVRISQEWNIDWYIYKGKFNKGRNNIPEIIKKSKVNVSALPMYEMETGRGGDTYVEYNQLDATLPIQIGDEDYEKESESKSNSYIMDENDKEHFRKVRKLDNDLINFLNLLAVFIFTCTLGTIFLVYQHNPFRNIILYWVLSSVWLIILHIKYRRRKK